MRTPRAFWALVLGSSLVFLCCATPPRAAQFPGPEERLARYGLRLQRDTRVVVHDSVDEFREATGKTDPRYRAWTRFDVVHLYGPANEDRLTHELCHAAIHQAFGDIERARRAQIPRFFEEGACAIIGEKHAQVMKRVEVFEKNLEMPLDIKTFEDDPEVAYAASLHVMQLVIDHHGRESIGKIVEHAAVDGTPGCVERALERVTGMDPLALWKRTVERG